MILSAFSSFHETFISDVFGRIVELKVPAFLLKNLKVLDTSGKENRIQVDINQIIEILFRKTEDVNILVVVSSQALGLGLE